MSTLPAVVRRSPGVLPGLNQQQTFSSPPLSQNLNATYKFHFAKNQNDTLHHLQTEVKPTLLSKHDIALYRNSHKHNICIDMLREGYHKSFSELFALIQKWNALREAAGPGSAIWQQRPLEEQPEKLDQLQHFLTRAEAAQRAGYYEERYNNRLSLARYFKTSGDKWLSDHFFESCLNIAKGIKNDGGRKEAEAHGNMGLVYEEQSQLEKAAEHYEAFHHLTVGRIWKDETGCTHHSLACENLWRIYTLLADKMLENKEYQQAIKTLIKAFEMAKEGGNKTMEGKAAYRVGLAYLSAGDPQMAITYLNTYMEISKALCDNVSLGKAYEAMAKALESQGKIAETIQYLEMFVEVAKRSNISQSLVDACVNLGIIFNSEGDYGRACECFKEAYEVARNLDNLTLLETTQVHYGIANAHKMMTAVSSHIEAAKHVNIEYLLAWKDSRNDMFSGPNMVGERSTSENETTGVNIDQEKHGEAHDLHTAVISDQQELETTWINLH